MTQLKQQILQLKSDGKSYRQIQQILNCSKSTISYHLNDNQKSKTRQRTNKRRSTHPFINKLNNFKRQFNIPTRIQTTIKSKKLIQMKIYTFFNKGIYSQKRGKYVTPAFTVEDVLNKIGIKPICYLTGREININEPRSYQFDHIVPPHLGGTNNIDNLGLTCKAANMAKSDLSKEEFLQLCLEVVKHNKLI